MAAAREPKKIISNDNEIKFDNNKPIKKQAKK